MAFRPRLWLGEGKSWGEFALSVVMQEGRSNKAVGREILMKMMTLILMTRRDAVTLLLKVPGR